MKNQKEIEEIAKYLHETYEDKARLYGWVTQEVCRVPFNELPEANAKTMLAVAKDIFSLIQSEKKKWKAEMMDGLDSLKVIEPPDEVGELSDKRQAFMIGQMNLLMRIQQLRKELEEI